jgi:hypothetical protein
MEPLQLSLFDPLSSATEKVDIEVRTEQLVDWVIQEMEREGLNRAAQQQFLMQLQVRTLMESYLAKIPPGQRWQFVVRLIKAIQELEMHSEGF